MAAISSVLGFFGGWSVPAPVGTANSLRNNNGGRRIEFTLKIDRQEGRNFSGTFSTGSYQEAVVGAFAADFKTGVMADLDGQMSFRLVGKNHMDMCYTHTGASAPSKVAACTELKRR